MTYPWLEERTNVHLELRLLPLRAAEFRLANDVWRTRVIHESRGAQRAGWVGSV
jgi:hypothetical protein